MEQPSRQPSDRRVSLPVKDLSLIVDSLAYAREHLRELKDVSEAYASDSADTLDKLMCEEMGIQIAIMEELVAYLKPLLVEEAS